MSSLQQIELTHSVESALNQFLAKYPQLHSIGLVYFLVSFTWGLARRHGWSIREFLTYQQQAISSIENRIARDTLGTPLR